MIARMGRNNPEVLPPRINNAVIRLQKSIHDILKLLRLRDQSQDDSVTDKVIDDTHEEVTVRVRNLVKEVMPNHPYLHGGSVAGQDNGAQHSGHDRQPESTN